MWHERPRIILARAFPLLVLMSFARPAWAVTFENLLTRDSLLGVVCAVRDGLFPLLMTFAVIAFVAAGMFYLIAQGDPTKLTRAKKALIAAIIGAVLAILSLGAAFIIAEIFGVSAAQVC